MWYGRLAALLSTAAAAALAACLLTTAESDLVAGCHGWSWLLPHELRLACILWGRRGGKGREGDVRVVERRWSRWRRSWAQGPGSVARRRKASFESIAVSFYPAFLFLLAIEIP